MLAFASDHVDAYRFAALAAEGHVILADGDPERAADLLRDALGLWRGPALVDFAYEPFAQPEIARPLPRRRVGSLAHSAYSRSSDRNQMERLMLFVSRHTHWIGPLALCDASGMAPPAVAWLDRSAGHDDHSTRVGAVAVH